ncbi:MAG TPA: hypothetical protein PKG89_16720 [Ferruginibacter sp.]|nr:hypothetical protein [Ferruginibacter sp.]HNN72896.1 hypothetical protein [Ferruginibacter sp.]
MAVFSVSFAWHMRQFMFTPDGSLTNVTSTDIIFSGLFCLAISLYLINSYWGIKLVTYLDRGTIEKMNYNRRKVFWFLEILAGIGYTALIYVMVTELRISGFWPLNSFNIVRAVFVISFSCGCISSLTRIFLTWPMINMAKRKAGLFIEQIGTE